MKIGIIGGGMTGLATAYYLSKQGHKVTLFEKEKQLGGFASAFEVNGIPLEKYYHHIFKYETNIQKLCEEIGIISRIKWIPSKVGMYYQNKIFPFGTPFDLINLTPVPFPGRVRLGLFSLLVPKIKNWRKLESISAETWLKKYLDKKTYEIIWKPLLENKFGDYYREVPASYVWERLSMRTTSKSSLFEREKLGYIEGSFQIVIDTLAEKIRQSGGKIKTNTKVDSLSIKNNEIRGVVNKNKLHRFDHVISTIALPQFTKLVPDLPPNYLSKLNRIEYSGVVCLILLLKNKLSNFYWTNIHDQNFPFRLMIEHTNLIPSRMYNSHVVYLARYEPLSVNKQLKMTAEQIYDLYIPYLKKMFPQFTSDQVRSYHLFKGKYSNPIISLNYSEKKPVFKTPIKGLYIVEKSQLSRVQQGTDNCVKLADRFMKSQNFNNPNECLS